MAAVATIFGGMVGFLTAALGLILFSLSPLHALALWSGTGIATAFALIALGLATQHSDPASWPAPRGPQANLP